VGTISLLCINFFTYMQEILNKENIREEFRSDYIKGVDVNDSCNAYILSLNI
jgi:hypothetical protein